MYDFYCTKAENNRYRNGENINFSTLNGEKVVEIFDLPATTQKSYYGKAKVIVTEKARYLLSYNTIICSLVYSGAFRKHWNDWSATTAKHINDFMRFTRFGNGFSKKEWNTLDSYNETGVVYRYNDFNNMGA